jgi:predicted metal-dependent phosphoesterase TrpH
MLKVELHAHTADDPVDRIPYSTYDLIDRAAALAYDALAVTLHERQLDVARFRRYAAQRGVVLIPGVERTIEGRHVLLLNFSRRSETVATFADLAELKAHESGLVVAPHPFFPSRVCLHGDLDRHAHLFDAVERNAMFVRGLDFNERAEQWAAAHAKPIVGNGDVHRLSQLGTTWSFVEGDADPEAICEAVRGGRVVVESRPLSYAEAVRVVGAMLLDHVSFSERKLLHAIDLVRLS